MISGQITSLATVERDNTILRQVLDSLPEYQWPHGVERPEWLGKIVQEVDECVRVLVQRLKGQEIQTHYLLRRAEIQLTAVSHTFDDPDQAPRRRMLIFTLHFNQLFNLINQQETRLSISVAQDSRTIASATKDDSTAMKTLAAVTVFFLPGTFVAAFFSMLLFQWGTQTIGHSAVSRQFWIYGAVSIPLTIMTLTLWFAWMRLQARRHRARNSEGRAALNRELDAPLRELQESVGEVLDKEPIEE